MRVVQSSKCTVALLLAAAVALAAPVFAKPQTSSSATTAKTAPLKKTVPRSRVVRKRKPRQRVQTAPTAQRISEIQSALAAQGTYKGQPNGKWDAATMQAMRDFQSSHGLTATGKLDALTLQKLGLGSEIAGRAAPAPLSQTRDANESTPQQTP
ncbi:MAG TPA: peptidoglycan-binding domain-containing protein [Candidatus Acidoferrales bacterium]|nr:peptidoglycan-binding domain-containing protein [Candidatus Acidoferrales bacterium]